MLAGPGSSLGHWPFPNLGLDICHERDFWCRLLPLHRPPLHRQRTTADCPAPDPWEPTLQPGHSASPRTADTPLHPGASFPSV